MPSPDLARDARKAWLEYEGAIVRAFGFPPGAKLDAGAFEARLPELSKAQVESLIKNLRDEAERYKNMKWIGER